MFYVTFCKGFKDKFSFTDYILLIIYNRGIEGTLVRPVMIYCVKTCEHTRSSQTFHASVRKLIEVIIIMAEMAVV